MHWFFVLCLMGLVSDSRPASPAMAPVAPIPDFAINQEAENLRLLGEIVAAAWDVVRSHEGPDAGAGFEFCTVHDVIDEFRKNQSVVDHLDWFITDFKIHYPNSKAADHFFAETREMRFRFWIAEARVLLQWARDLRPISYVSVGRVEIIKRDSNLEFSTLGTTEEEFARLQKRAFQQMKEEVGQAAAKLRQE